MDRRGSDRSDGNDRPGGSFRIEAKHARVRIAVKRARGRRAATLPAMPTPDLTSLATPILAAITFTPDPVAFHVGSIPVYWYGICYAVGLFLVYRVLTVRARRAGFDQRHVDNGIVIVGVAALIGGRLYHVIDQWQLYQNDPITAILPIARQADGSYQFAGITGLGVYGGIITGTIAVLLYTRWKHLPFWRWADVVAPALFVMQAVGRWGNFFNQELYGPPTNLPWGIAIECQHRVLAYPCAQYPFETTFFQPLFLYESLSGVLGFFALTWIGERYRHRLRPGDLLLIFFVWYGTVRFVLEFLRSDNWTFNGIATAQLVSIVMVVGALIVAAIRHRPGWEEREQAEWIRNGWVPPDDTAAVDEDDAEADLDDDDADELVPAGSDAGRGADQQPAPG